MKDSYEYVGLTPVEISGVKGQIQEVRYNFGNKWITEYEVMVQKNGYRYYLEYAIPDGQERTASNWKKFSNQSRSIMMWYRRISAASAKRAT